MFKLSLAAVVATAVLAAGSWGCSAPRSAAASTPEADAVLATVHQFVGGFNTGDTARAFAACTDDVSIIDEIPPYAWHGAGASARWLADYDADAKVHGITEGLVALGTPRHVLVSGDRAYVVAPADYAYEMQGKPVEQVGATFTFALQKTAAGWRITAWSWSQA